MPLPTGDILTETFDNAGGYDNSGWTATGTVDPNYTGTVLEGTQSLLLTGTSSPSDILRTASASSSIYVYFQFRMPNLPADNSLFMVLADSGYANYLLRLYVHTSGAIFIIGGSTFAGTSVGTMSANTTYHFWVTYIKGTGANAVANIGFSTDGVRPTSGNNYLAQTDGTGTTNFALIQLLAVSPGGTWTPIFDRVVLNSTQIGDATAATNVSVDLTGVAADPQIGAGTVEIGSAPVEPPVSPGGGTGAGRPARTGMRLRPTEDKAVYLKGVTANPQVGQVMVLHEMQRAYEAYSAPIRKAEARKPAEMPPGMRELFKRVEKPIPPAVFVYQVGLPKLKSAVGTVAVRAFYEDIDEETIAMIDLL